MSDPLRTAKSGERLAIPAAAWNALLGQLTRSTAGDATIPGDRERDLCLRPTSNATGEDLERFAVVGLGDMLIRSDENLVEFQNHPAFIGVKPAAAHAGRFAILQEPLAKSPEGRVVPAAVAGTTPCLVRIDLATHTRAECEANNLASLASGSAGSACILWRERPGETGLMWCVVRLCCLDELSAAAECPTPAEWTVASLVDHVARLVIDRCSSLGLAYRTADPSQALISILKGPGDSLFWSGSAASSCPQWHTTPRVKTGLHVGTANSYPAWLRLGQAWPVYHLNPPSGGGQKIRWPTADPPGINSHLYIDAKQGKGLQTEWGYQGCDADVYIDAGTSCGTKTCVYFQVRKGIVTNIQGLSVNPPAGDHGTVNSTIHLDSPYDPCTPSGKGLYFLADVVFETLSAAPLSVL